MATLQAALPREHYVDEAQYEREREIVLARSWTCAGRLTDVGLVAGARALQPNRLSVVALLGESVLVTTDADGNVVQRHAHDSLAWEVDPISLEGDVGEHATRPRHD